MANIETVKQVIRLCREADVALFLWGVHGIGKSSFVRQIATDLEIDFVDFRCAQIEASDLRGLPDKGADGRTYFLPPADLPTSGQGILFLDELNRANHEVLSAAFQLVLDQRVGQYQLPRGWNIVCAGNLENGDYTVAELDPALRDRFCHVLVSAGQLTFDEWADWMSQHYPERALDVVSFCGANLKHLEVVENEDLGFRITPSRRSWEMVARIQRVWDRGGYSRRTLTEAIAGLNPDFVASLTILELFAVIQHEVEHVVCCHCIRQPEQSSVAWNIAADMAVKRGNGAPDKASSLILSGGAFGGRK
ncbi:MAG: AAA family ATPase [Planctomycetes bacterium]|nr:AAA family ATPase [Planctomycetota bacterium]